MEITLPKDIAQGLPEPDAQGLVRVTIALKVGPDGAATVEEINDTPVAVDEEESSEPDSEAGADEETPMPSPDEMEQALYKQ